MKIRLTLLCAALAGHAFAQDKSSPDQIISAFNREFEAAYAKADVAALGAMFTDDAQYTSEDGTEFNGKAEIEGSLGNVFADQPGITVALQSDGVREIAPGVLSERGTSVGTSKNGERIPAQYTAVYVQKEGKWKISTLVESPLPEISAADRLSQLDWLLGKWEETDPANDVTVLSEFGLARGDNFITRNVTVKHSGQPSLEGWQIIGWDPVTERIRSWTFDSEGGFSDGRWTRAGNQWLVQEIGFAPDGSRTTSEVTISRVDQDRFTWESNNRTLDGEPQPSLARIEIKRVKGK